MGKKKKALLRYKRLGALSKKLEKKFSSFLQSHLDILNTKVEETLNKVEEAISTAKPPVTVEAAEEEVKVEKPKTTTNQKPTAKTTKTVKKSSTTTPKKTTSTTRRRRTTKTKQDS